MGRDGISFVMGRASMAFGPATAAVAGPAEKSARSTMPAELHANRAHVGSLRVALLGL
jgi:hypothetical protein